MPSIFICRAFNWKLATNSTCGYDASCNLDRRYQIKARLLAQPNGSRQLSYLRNLESHQFHSLAGILFSDDFSIYRTALIPHAQVREHSTRSERANAWIFHLTDKIWMLPEVEDVTEQLRAAYEDLN